MVEGLAGVVDNAQVFEEVTISPRWAAAGVQKDLASVCYPSSRGYVRYQYEYTGHELKLQVAGSGAGGRMKLMLPDEFTPGAAEINGKAIEYTLEGNDSGRYMSFPLTLKGAVALNVTAG